MAKTAVSLAPSLLDRLIDENPGALHDPIRNRTQQLRDLRDAVRRDLENLLNAHKRCISPPPDLEELALSVIEYGAPDFLATFAAASEVRETFRKSVEDTIRRFEPRFQTVSVELIGDDSQIERTLRFRIDALIYADPAPENVTYNSQLDTSNHSFQVLGGADG
jgi:type VI secretion system protein ImpF